MKRGRRWEPGKHYWEEEEESGRFVGAERISLNHIKSLDANEGRRRRVRKKKRKKVNE